MDRLKTLDEVLSNKSDWPCMDDIKQNQVFEPPGELEQINSALATCRKCLLVGPPRSGKTALVRIAALKKEKEGREIRCLNIADILDEEDLEHSVRFINDSNRLYIIENYHLHPQYWNHISQEIEKCNNTSFILSCTTFSSRDVIEIERRFTNIITVQLLPKVLVKGIINKWLETRGEDFPQDNISFKEEEYQKALYSIPGEKRIRGNLRYLSFRLKAWNPQERHLLEVGIDDVAQYVRSQIENIWPEWLFLQKVCIICQFELPFKLVQSYPKEAFDLLRMNLLTPILPDGLKIDSTDAYLFLRAYYNSQQWIRRTTDYLSEYLQDHPNISPNLIRNLLFQGGNAIVLGLIKNNEIQSIMEREMIAFLRQKEAGPARFYLLTNLVTCLTTKVNNKISKDELACRLAYIESYLDKIGAMSLAEIAKDVPLQPKMWFCRNLSSDPENRFQDFLSTFFTSMDFEELKQEIEQAPGSVQRKLLYYLKHITPELTEQLKSCISIKPILNKSLGYFLAWLMCGLSQSDIPRQRKIEWLLNIDEHSLLEKVQNHSTKPFEALGGLLYTASWLNDDKAKKIAEWIPGWIQNIVQHNKSRINIKALGLLIRNSCIVNREATKELLKVLFTMSPRELLYLDEQTQQEAISYFLYEAGLAGQDILIPWCSQDIEFWQKLVVSSNKQSACHLLIELQRFAPHIVKEIFKQKKIELQKQFNNELDIDDLPLHGMLALYDTHLSYVNFSLANHIYKELGSKFTIPEIILTLYGIQETFGADKTSNIIKELVFLPGSSNLILSLAHHPNNWSPEDVNDMLNRLIAWRIKNVEDALNNQILFYLPYAGTNYNEGIHLTKLQEILEHSENLITSVSNEQSSNIKVVNTNATVPKLSTIWLQKAVHEGIIRNNKGIAAISNILWHIDRHHPLVNQVLQKINKVILSMQETHKHYADGITIDRWDAILDNSMNSFEVDYWRQCLINTGAIRINTCHDKSVYGISFSIFEGHPLLRYIG